MNEFEDKRPVEIKNETTNEESLLECLSPNRHLFFFLAGFVGLFVFVSLVVTIFSLMDQNFTMENPKSYSLVMFISYSLIFGTVLLCCLYDKPIVKKVLKNFTKSDTYSRGILFGVFLMLGSLVVANIMAAIGTSLGVEQTINENETVVREMIRNFPVLTFMSVVILAPICEEFAYRVGLFGGFRRFGRPAAYIISACVFGLIHANFDSANWINELLNLPSYIFAGVFLCYTYEKHDSIEVAITAHAFNNFITFLLSYFIRTV